MEYYELQRNWVDFEHTYDLAIEYTGTTSSYADESGYLIGMAYSNCAYEIKYVEIKGF
jgi:hypothetical protein